MASIKLRRISNSDEIELIQTVGDYTCILTRLIKNVKHTWRRRRGSLSTRPLRRAKDRNEDLVVYTMEGTCDETTAKKLEEWSKEAEEFRLYSPAVAVNNDICTNHQSRCPPTGGEYGYDLVTFSSCEVELLAGKKEEFTWTFRMSMEESKTY